MAAIGSLLNSENKPVLDALNEAIDEGRMVDAFHYVAHYNGISPLTQEEVLLHRNFFLRVNQDALERDPEAAMVTIEATLDDRINYLNTRVRIIAKSLIDFMTIKYGFYQIPG